MTNTTTEYWEVDGVSLSQFAWNVKTYGGSPRGLIPLRGENLQIAYRVGQEFRAKVADSRRIELEMWVAGIDPDSDAYVSNPHVQFVDNLRYLQRLFWTPSRQIELTRRWDTSEGLYVATALAQIDGGLEPEMRGPSAAELTVSLHLADPYFYGEVSETVIVLGDAATTITNSGDDSTTGYGCEVEFSSGLVSPRVTNTTPTTPVYAEYSSTTDQATTLDLQHSIAYLADTTVVSGLVTASGSRQWFELVPGENTIEFSATSGAGTATIRFRPPYV
jgi:hypothetical protein